VRRRSRLYLDASALVKTVVAEPESSALRAVIARADVAASELVLAEVPRALARLRFEEDGQRHGVGSQAARVLAGLDLVEVTRPLLASAGRLAPPRLRTLDAVHVASALALGDSLDAFVTYDRRQRSAAAAGGLAVLSPGATA